MEQTTTPAWDPGRILSVSGAYWQGCALQAAVRLDLFTALDGRALTAEQAAEALGTAVDVDALARLLEALAAMGLLEADAGRFADTEAAAVWLSKASDRYLGYMILHHHQLLGSWMHLEQAVCTGRPQGKRDAFDDPAYRENFLMGMYNNGLLNAPAAAAALDLSSRKKLLDLGGGPGTYAVFFCQANEGLQADVFDLPTTEPFARKVIARHGMEGRIGFIGGDFTRDRLPSGYDAVWMSHILHSMGLGACRKLVADAYRAMEPGGLVAIHEFILDDDRPGPLFPALFSLNMLVRTDQGRAYRQAELMDMLAAAGFRAPRRLDFTGPSQSGIIVAER